MIHTTDWKYFTGEDGRYYRIRAKYGFDLEFAARNNQAPHFSVTGETQRREDVRWREGSGGCIHEEIAKHFPELAPLLKWHLVSTEEPMHYFANGIFWWDHVIGRQKFREAYEWQKYGSPHEAALHHFKSTIVFGALPDDVLPPEETAPREVREWMAARLPRLMEVFRKETNAPTVQT